MAPGKTKAPAKVPAKVPAKASAKPKAPGKTLNAANLELLGAAQLAALLIEVSKGNAPIQRRLRLSLAGQGGSAEAARAITKRLSSIAGAKTWLDWQKIKPLAVELEGHRRAILDLVAPKDPREGFELMWRLAACAGPVLGRSDDGSGQLGAVFEAAVEDLGPLAVRAGFDTEELAGRTFRALSLDEHGVWYGLVPVLAAPLGPAGLQALQVQVRGWQAEPLAVPPAKERRVIGWSSNGPIHADEIVRSHRKTLAATVLRQLADALGDVDAYVAQFSAPARAMPGTAAEIARRLLAAKRPKEALAALDAVPARARGHAPAEWVEARAEALQALGRADEAQAFRWQRFLDTLEPGPLRAHLKALPDFDDFEAEQRALDHAAAFRDAHRALHFLVAWPDLQRAAALVQSRTAALDGNLYEVLSPAAEALDARYPLAATLLRRAMIGFALKEGRSSRYRHAARHLRECRAAAARIEAFGTVLEHGAFERSLRAAHGRKAAFWEAADAA